MTANGAATRPAWYTVVMRSLKGPRAVVDQEATSLLQPWDSDQYHHSVRLSRETTHLVPVIGVGRFPAGSIGTRCEHLWMRNQAVARTNSQMYMGLMEAEQAL